MRASHITHRLTALCKTFISDQGGSILTYAALAIIPIAGFSGVAIDSARGYLLRSHLSESLDAAALAAGRAMTLEEVQTDVSRFFDLNFRDGYMGATVEGPTATFSAETGEIHVSARAHLDTSFMKLLGQDDIYIQASTRIKRNVRGMELALIMDNTGSMRSSSKMSTMKNAALDLVDILYGERESIDDFWISVVPYTASVNIGNAHYAWLQNYQPSDYNPTVWKGCVEARPTPYDLNDDPPTIQMFNPYFYPDAEDNDWPPIREENSWQNNGRGPNLGCGPAITPLTDRKSTIRAAIQEMQPWHRGGTLTNMGLVWGWRTLSPRWRGLWRNSDVALPLDYDTPLMDKVAIILTDGQNLFFDFDNWGPDGSDYTAYGREGWNRLGINGTGISSTTEVNNRMAETCRLMKEEGVIIYTITFRLSNSTARQLFRDCATSSAHYFNSPSNSELQTVFQRIGGELSNLRIAQ